MDVINLNGSDWIFKEFVGLDWVWRDSVKPNTKDVRWWESGTVPGTVLNDLWKAGKVPDPYFELNSKLVEWVPARTWVYRKTFAVPEELLSKRALLRFEGVDYSAEFYLNGSKIGSHEGMYVPFEIDVTGMLQAGENLLAVVLEAAPPEQPQVGMTSLTNTHKSRMTYWWDFCPRMIHQGIWDSVFLKFTGEAVLDNVYTRAELNEDCSKAVLIMEAECRASDGCLFIARVAGMEQSAPVEKGKAVLRFELNHPRLWQPNGYGEHYEYEIHTELRDVAGKLSDEKDMLYGIRKIEWEKNDGASSDAPNFVLKVNNRRIYINGYNWVPIDVMYGVERPEKLRRLIRLAKDANVNMFRVWGGGLIEKEEFYRACAENGILVWQEFILSSSGIDNKTPENPDFIEMFGMQAEVIIKGKRNHTALALWCGGNELQDLEGNPLDCNDPLLHMLDETVARLDPLRRFLPTSPSGGVFLNSVENIQKCPDRLHDVHGPWEHQGLNKHYALYNMGTSLFHTEFGVEGMTNRNTLMKSVAAEHLLPASKDNEIYFHRGAWWTNEPLVQETFGGLDTIDKIRLASQYMQYEGLKYAVECNRSRGFQNSGTFPWQFNEPYPNCYCTANVDYYANPKPVYYGVKNAYSPVMVSAKFRSPSLLGQDSISFDVRLCSALKEREIQKLGRTYLCWSVAGMNGRMYFRGERPCELPENRSLHGMKMDFPIKDMDGSLILLRLEVKDGSGNVIAKNEYLFTKDGDLGAMFQQECATLELTPSPGQLEVQNTGDVAALWINLVDASPLPQEKYLYFNDNYFILLPGETRKINIDVDGNKTESWQVIAEGFNCYSEVSYPGA